MAGNRYAPEIKTAVLKLGTEGATYREIQEQFPIPKSTLSVWFNGVDKGRGKDRSYMRAHLVQARIKAVAAIRHNKEARLATAFALATNASYGVPLQNKDVLKSLAAMLYWAEGSKSDRGLTVFTNTDPLLSLFYIDLLRKTFALDESKLRIRLHLHYYHKHSEALDFWSNLLKVPKSQFGKIYVKKRSKQKRFRQNFKGICFIIYNDVSVRRELMDLGRLLAEKVTTHKLSSFNG